MEIWTPCTWGLRGLGMIEEKIHPTIQWMEEGMERGQLYGVLKGGRHRNVSFSGC